MNGWIKLHRSIKDHWVFRNPIFFQRWCIMLLEVNHTNNMVSLGYNVHSIKIGQSAKSIRTWAALFECGTKQATNFFNMLENDDMIEKEVLGQGKQSTTLITISNYEQYQTSEKRKANARQTQSKRKGHTNKNVKKENNILLKDVLSPPDGVDILHFYIAKGFYNIFLLKGNTKTLDKAKLHYWVDIIRLLLNEDKVTIQQLVAIKYYFEKCQRKEKGVKTWWFDNMNSVAAFRKKNKHNEYHYDSITNHIKHWVKSDTDVQSEVLSRTKKLKDKC